MDIAAALKAFGAVFPAELPDKTMVATIVLVARYQRPLAVWCGAAAAFSLHVVVAVAAGSLLTLLPESAVTAAIAGLFTVGALLLWRSAAAQAAEVESELAESGSEVDARLDQAGAGDAVPAVVPGQAPSTDAGKSARQPLRVAVGSFAVIAVAEWGDLTQLATGGLAGSTGAPVEVAIGALLALWTVSALAAMAGRGLVSKLPLDKLQRAAACVFAALAVLTLLTLR